MSIVLRVNKGSALTYDEMDKNQSQFYYSSSVHGTTGEQLRLHISGSGALGSGFGTRYHTIPFPTQAPTTVTATAAGDPTNIQFKGSDNNFAADPVFVFIEEKNYLGIATGNPQARLHINSDENNGAHIILRGDKTSFPPSYVKFEQDSDSIGYIGRVNKNDAVKNIDIVNDYVYVNSRDTFGKVNVSITQGATDGSTGPATDNPVATFSYDNNIKSLGIGTQFPDRNISLVGRKGIGISSDEDLRRASYISPLPQGVIDAQNETGLKTLIPDGSQENGLFISSPNTEDGGNIVVALNTDTGLKEGFNIIRSDAAADNGNYTDSKTGIIFSAQASGKVGINTNFPADAGLTVVGIVSGSGLANFGGNLSAGGNLNITGNSSLQGTLDVTGDTSVSTFDSTGATSLATGGGVVNISKTGVLTTVKGTLNVDEAVTLDSTLDVTGNSKIEGKLEVSGIITGSEFRKTGGTGTQVLLANGSVRTVGASGDIITSIAYGTSSSTIYQKLSSGLIIQGGIINRSGDSSTGNNYTVNFPIAFPNAVLSINVTSGRSGPGSQGYDYVHTVTNSSFKAVLEATGDLNENYFFAIGH